MPNIQDRKNERFGRYDAMSTEDLQAFLREDASKPMGEESDTAEVFYVMEILAKRRKAQSGGKDPAEALESLKQNYYKENETPYISESVPVARNQGNSGRWKRGLAAAVAVIFFLVIGNSITASALHFDLFAIIAKWTQETFHFGYAEPSEPDTNTNNQYIGLQQALDIYKITLKLAPTWFPNNYIENDVKTVETPAQRQFIARYKDGESEIKIRIADYLNSQPEQIEQSSAVLEIYKCTGIDYYIFNDNGQLRAAWVNGSFECYITGPVSIEEMKDIINSIEKG